MISSTNRNVHHGGLGNSDPERQDDLYEDEQLGGANLYTFGVVPDTNIRSARNYRASDGLISEFPLDSASGSFSGESVSSDLSGSPIDATPRQVDDQLHNVEQILQELVKRNEIMQGPSRKRKLADDNRGRILGAQAEEHFKAHMMSQFTEDSDSDDEYSSYQDYPLTTVATLPKSHFESTFSANSFLFSDHEPMVAPEFMPDFSSYLPHVPEDIFDQIQAPLRGFSPSTKVLSPVRSTSLEQTSNHVLFQAFLQISAERLSHTSPTYIDIWRRYVPAMAQDSPALMEAMLAIGALQSGLLRHDEHMITVEATNHYNKALALHGQALADPDMRASDAPLATAMIMTHYELWQGENVKMGLHMLGGKEIILGRGKEAFMTPVGRALFTNFKRFDIASSAISGNPCFLTHDWWFADPMTRIPVVDDAPPLFVADSLLSKSTIICSKLTYVKAWAIRKRRDLWIQTKGGTTPNFEEKKKRLQESIVRKCERLEADVDDWKSEFPDWFRASDDNVFTGEDGEEEDINQTDIHVIFPLKYSHWAIACMEAWEIAMRLQMYRVKYPDQPIADPKMGALVHKMLRIWAFLPIGCDGLMMPCLFVAGTELRKKPHQKWFCDMLQLHMAETSFAGFMFVLQGCRFAWLKLEGLNKGRFARVKEGSTARIEGVSENLWSAEGVLGALEALSLYDSPDVGKQRKNFEGDLDQGLTGEVEFEDPDNEKKDKAEAPNKRVQKQDPRQQKHRDKETTPPLSSPPRGNNSWQDGGYPDSVNGHVNGSVSPMSNRSAGTH